MRNLKLLARTTVFAVTFFFTDLGAAEAALWRDLSQKEVAPQILKLQQRQQSAEARYLWIDRAGLNARVSAGLASGDQTFFLSSLTLV